MPAVRLCKAVGCRLESGNVSLTRSGLCGATLPLPLPDPTSSLTQPLTGMQLQGESVQGAESIKN